MMSIWMDFARAVLPWIGIAVLATAAFFIAAYYAKKTELVDERDYAEGLCLSIYNTTTIGSDLAEEVGADMSLGHVSEMVADYTSFFMSV